MIEDMQCEPRTLVTGFGPFGMFAANPSSQLAAECGRPFRILEVSYAAVDQFLEELSADSFDLLVMLGVSGKSQRMQFEMNARNWVGSTSDVRGTVLGPAEIDPADPPQFTISSPLTISASEHWEVSFDAGEYLCNYIFFRALQRFFGPRILFIHVPPFEAMPHEVQLREIRWMLAQLERR